MIVREAYGGLAGKSLSALAMVPKSRIPDTEINAPAIVFMKVGYHVDETLGEIIERKRAEQRVCGMIFWGYGGTTCHPIKHVAPFALEAARASAAPLTVFSITRSAFVGRRMPARQFSADGVHWYNLPKEVIVTGSRYALICDDLQETESLVRLSDYQVAIGPSVGTRLDRYLRFRIDKACARLVDIRHSLDTDGLEVEVSFMGRLAPPYAVLLR